MRTKNGVEVGNHVIYIDNQRRKVNALVNCLHGRAEPMEYDGEVFPRDISCINIIHLSQDPNREDSYGRQSEHVTSLNHCGDSSICVGHCWHFPEETFEIDESNVGVAK